MPSTENSIIQNELMDAANARLKSLMPRLATESGRSATLIDGLTLTRWNGTEGKDTCFYAPAIGLIVQGRKESLIGSQTFKYGEMDCLVNGVTMPSISTILEATPEKPLFAVSLKIDKAIATELVAQLPGSVGLSGTHHPGVALGRVTADVLDAFVRLVETLEKPEQIALRAPLLIREIIIRTLLGPQGAALRNFYTLGSHSNQVADAVSWLRENYKEPLHIEALAERVGMATSTFHRQFKKVTSISPLQYQKCLRLYEAQRLMLAEDVDANHASWAVGYESVQQFNREYRRMFGEPPHRNIKKLRDGITNIAP